MTAAMDGIEAGGGEGGGEGGDDGGGEGCGVFRRGRRRGQLLCQTCNNALMTMAKKCPVFLRAKGGKRVSRCM